MLSTTETQGHRELPSWVSLWLRDSVVKGARRIGRAKFAAFCYLLGFIPVNPICSQ
jgi:hypothetical protein